ncbi:MAG: exosortase/archaeosortase family protein [candidate division Zixibacteria bacterium]|nr:exosortase/archaeosortase family protein [candidate division Zixibacteria bacterium]
MNIIKGDVLASVKRHQYPYILTAIILLFNIPVFDELIGDWIRDDNYSHGFLIIPISIFLFYRKRKDLVFPAGTCNWGLAAMLFGCLGFIFGIAAGEYFTTRFSLILIISSLSLYHLGIANFRKVWFAFFFLIFMIPIPAVIYHSATLPMQLFATKVTDSLLQVIGVPAIRQGNIIYLPEYALEVAEACSGLRSLATLMALGALYGHLTMPGRSRPVILFLATIPIAIITNIIRLLFTAVGAYAISTKLAEDFLHELSGMLVFITAMIMLFILGAILKWPKKRS